MCLFKLIHTSKSSGRCKFQLNPNGYLRIEILDGKYWQDWFADGVQINFFFYRRPEIRRALRGASPSREYQMPRDEPRNGFRVAFSRENLPFMLKQSTMSGSGLRPPSRLRKLYARAYNVPVIKLCRGIRITEERTLAEGYEEAFISPLEGRADTSASHHGAT